MRSASVIAFAACCAMFADLPVARAEDPPGCPPGEWFCEDDGSEPMPEPAEPDLPDSPDETTVSPPAAPTGRDEAPAGRRAIELGAAAPPVIESPWSEGSGGRRSPWSLALRAEGVLVDGGSGREDARLGGIGVSGRYAVNPVLTLDLGVDSISGRDYSGQDRSELTLSLSSLLYLNQHRVVRTYALVGLNASSAQVDVRGHEQTWGYFGAHTGLGLDVSLGERLALNLDFVGFMRGRTDSRAAREPEFTDRHGRVTNTSGGGLFRGGLALHF